MQVNSAAFVSGMQGRMSAGEREVAGTSVLWEG